jgi:hypothetical protein
MIDYAALPVVSPRGLCRRLREVDPLVIRDFAVDAVDYSETVRADKHV